MLVVYPEVFGKWLASCKVHDHGCHAIELDALGAVRIHERLAVLHEERVERLGDFFGEDLEGTVVEYVAVLVDLHEAGAAVRIGLGEHLAQLLGVAVHGAGDEGGIGPLAQCKRVEGMVHAAHGCALGDGSFW